MDCKEIRDIIITDYADNRAGAKAGEVELHLSGCAKCRSFKEALMSGVVGPLRNTAQVKPPEALWYKVRAGVERLQDAENIFDFGNIMSSFLPRWANIAAIVSLMVVTSFAGSFFAHNYWEKQSTQSASVVAEESDSLALGELNDIPNEQTEKVYSNIIGG
jgi:hypothetical protein